MAFGKGRGGEAGVAVLVNWEAHWSPWSLPELLKSGLNFCK